jgi:hypothetical protein
MKVWKKLNGKKTVLGAIVSLATLIFAGVTGQEIGTDSVGDIITLIGTITGGGLLTTGIGHKVIKAIDEGERN